MKEIEKLFKKDVKLTKLDNFILYGEIVDYNDAGVWLETKTELSFINFKDIKELRLNRGGDRRRKF